MTEIKWKEFRKIIDGKLDRGSLAYDAYVSKDQYLMHFDSDFFFKKELEHMERLSTIYKTDHNFFKQHFSFFKTYNGI